jgi:hypothetical protein
MPITMERLEKEMGNRFGYELKMYVYHKMNGRDAEAQTYLDAYYEEQDKIKQEYDEGERELRSQQVYEEVKEEL